MSISAEILPELRRAHDELAPRRIGKVGIDRNQFPSTSRMPRTWAQYCEDVGMTNRYANILLAGPTVGKGTGNQENYTPFGIINAARLVLGEIDLDPASCKMAQATVGAKTYYTEEENGLVKPWFGRVFLNPPYQHPLIEEFVDKLLRERPNYEAAILLTNNNTDTAWFRKGALASDLMCFTEGRINFYTEEIEKTQPTNGQAFFYFGEKTERFTEIFSQQGLVMKVIK